MISSERFNIFPIALSSTNDTMSESFFNSPAYSVMHLFPLVHNQASHNIFTMNTVHGKECFHHPDSDAGVKSEQMPNCTCADASHLRIRET